MNLQSTRGLGPLAPSGPPCALQVQIMVILMIIMMIIMIIKPARAGGGAGGGWTRYARVAKPPCALQVF